MTILVTGSAGHLGEALMRSLRAEDRAAAGLDILPAPFTDIVGSVADRGVVAPAMQGVRTVLHTATLHKPHVDTHGRDAFVETNVRGTLILLEEAVRAGVERFIMTSTTSAFGDALKPPPGEPAAWIDETVAPSPKNIYGVTKTAAEDLCRLFWRNEGLPCIVLRTSRFFPEADDDPEARAAFPDDNLKLNEFLYRRVAIEDVVEAHLAAAERAPAIGFGKYIISATTPFQREDAARLRSDAAAVARERAGGWREEYARRGWRMAASIDRVYDNALARAELGWRPKWDFESVVARLKETGDIRGPLAKAIGEKGYHPGRFENGPGAAS
ncbi:nucleoside-diphosphate-sugar epimerase [Roseiarcus fermentans]|uniref:Nucleoside-diphosphate-sugar epimerase n=1 Tax=Roseiarcus fermentans TaxID=1473586 RepID=A0A366F364_9HYPH|nr:NAD(P)-dependent oxidoreductase [Roseiarcus fermentans]RBP08596.1 nucleoside-diphosphate-sugar epimerase [Roseiarcus fermentans]